MFEGKANEGKEQNTRKEEENKKDKVKPFTQGLQVTSSSGATRDITQNSKFVQVLL